MKSILLSGFAASFLIGSAVSASNAAEDKLLAFAHERGRIAGAARFCNADPEMIDEFTALTDAQLAVMSKDDYEKVLARLEFKNVATAAAAKAPEGGCDAFVPQFEQAVRDAR